LIGLGVHPALLASDTSFVSSGNPIITHKYTADPAAMVYKDTLFLYAGHDEPPVKREGYVMNEWLCFSTTDLKNWHEYKVPLRTTDFVWSKGDAWASQVIERNGKFYWYVATSHATTPGKAIGVAVSDRPEGPYHDAVGKAIITNDMTESPITWDDIDPTVFVDENNQAWLFWGNTNCYYAKLKPNMIELDGPIQKISLPHFTEAPWIHKYKDWYYLSYAYEFPEKTAYAISKSIEGPWEYKGILNEVAGNCNTNHQAIVHFKSYWYFIYHNGSINTGGGSFRRSVCIDNLQHNKDGSLQRVQMTSEGVQPVASK
jgi:beta-xylosidase